VEARRVLLQNVPKDESASQGQKCLVYVCALLIANSQSAKLIQPREAAFHHLPPSAQSTAMFSVALGEQRHNMPGTETSPDCFRIISTVAYEVIRTMARAAMLSLQGRDCFNKCECLLRVVTVCSSELDSEWNSALSQIR
jgi:hypothetical protein